MKEAGLPASLITLQETIHQVFDDRELRRASMKLYESGHLDLAIKKEVDFMIKTDNGKLYQHAILSAACAIPDAKVKDFWSKTR